MIAEIISVGTEILLGNIVNTNTAYLAEELAKLGCSAHHQVAVGDNEEFLKEAISVAKNRADIILLTGGLGPTQDDLTKEVVAKFFQKEMHLHQESKQRIEEFFQLRGILLTENNWKQAMIPEGAEVLTNDNGTAPGLILSVEGVHTILLPGPPNELKPMFESSVVPYLQTLSKASIYSLTLRLCGIGESQAETQMLDMIESQTNPTIATYAKLGQVDIRITAKGEHQEEAIHLIEPVAKELRKRFAPYIYSENAKESLEESLIHLFCENGHTLAVAESCTGGLLGSCLVNISGASSVFKAGFITYANEAKENLLKVSQNTLQVYGAVSEEVALEMVEGVVKEGNSDCGISITGIAGPEGGSEKKPVGLVYIAFKCGEKVKVHKYNIQGNREKVRNSAVVYALIGMRKLYMEWIKR